MKRIIVTVLIMIVIICISIESMAESPGVLSLTTDKSEVGPGDTITITGTFKSILDPGIGAYQRDSCI